MTVHPLPGEFLAPVRKQTLQFEPGKVIYKQGDPAPSVFYMEEGSAVVVVAGDQDKEAIIEIIEAGTFFGESCLDGTDHRMSTATALVPCRVIEITKGSILKLFQTSPVFAEAFLRHVVHKHNRTRINLAGHLFKNSAEHRLMRLLLTLAHFGEDDGPRSISKNVTQEMMAEMIGSTRPRVNAFMSRFRQMGLIEYNGAIKVNGELITQMLESGKPIKLVG